MTLFDVLWSLGGWIVDVAVSIPLYFYSMLSMFVNVMRVSTALLGFLPPQWTAPVLATLGAVIGLKLYSFIKEISVNGWRI